MLATEKPATAATAASPATLDHDDLPPSSSAPATGRSAKDVAAPLEPRLQTAPRLVESRDGNDFAAHVLSMAPAIIQDAASLQLSQPGPASLALGPDLPARAAEAPMPASPPQPAAPQVMPALISLANGTDGSNEMVLSLHPRDLGQVEIRLVRGRDGSTAVTITASQPATLQELSQNVHHLHAALDAANVPADGRSMNFMTSSPSASDQGPRSDDTAGREAASSQDGGRSPDQGSSRQGQQGQSSRTVHEEGALYGSPAPTLSRRRWQLSGLNITA